MRTVGAVETLMTFTSLDQALLARSVLEGSGIPAIVPDENALTAHWFYSDAGGGIRLQVFPQDREAALEVLAELQNAPDLPPDADEPQR